MSGKDIEMRRWLCGVVLIAITLALAACSTAGDLTDTGAGESTPALTGADIQRIAVAEAYELLGRDLALFYDTRTLEEYRTLHIAGALPFPEAEMRARYGELPLDQTIVFY
jgi:hypothetical protein